jgi:ABC-type multidrug transport system fused ATPase/permease subunit
MPNISKYVIESVVVLGALGISAAQFLMQDSAQAIATLAVFLAAGTRIAPAVMRVQQGALQIKSSLGVASPTIRLINSLKDLEPLDLVSDKVQTEHESFNSKIVLNNVSLKYSEKDSLALDNVSLTINEGTSVALVGPSGAGKTSLVDVILGVIQPSSGSITISGTEPSLAVTQWPGAIGYVPQDVVLINGTIRENVALGFPPDEANEGLIHTALEIAQLNDFIQSERLGIDMRVGERGARISGGQRQRIGLARALFTKPKLLVLDEATSALDGETEATITEAISRLKGSVTVLMIAHRLSTIRNVDQVVYMENGKIIYSGIFDEVRNSVPDFDNQAKLMGL